MGKVTLEQLKDAGLKVYLKESSFALSEMFSDELKFTIDLLIKWFYSVYKILYRLDSDIEDIDHDCIESFLRVDLNDQYKSFNEVYDAINQQKN